MKHYRRRLFMLAVPLIFNDLITEVQSLVDQIFLGRLDILLVSSVGNAMAPLFTTANITLTLGLGASILISQAVGEGDIEKAQDYAASMSVFHNIIPVVLTVFWIVAAPFVFRLMGVSENLMGNCVTYARIYAPIFLCAGVKCTMTTVLQTYKAVCLVRHYPVRLEHPA